MHVYFVRHGETFLTSSGVHQSPNTPLSPRGHEQVESVAEYFRAVNPDLILTSGYTRAVETARGIGLRTGKVPKVHHLFCEIVRPSSLYQVRLASFATLRYVMLSFFHRKNPEWHYQDAENYTDICNRAYAARDYLEVLSKKQKTVVVVSHTVFIRMILSVLCRDTVPGTFEMVKIFFGIIRFPYTGVLHLEYAPVAPKSKTCAWTIITANSYSAREKRKVSRSVLTLGRLLAGMTRAGIYIGGAVLIAGGIGLGAITQQAHKNAIGIESTSPQVAQVADTAFPVGVDPIHEEITETPQVETFFAEYVREDDSEQTAWVQKALSHLALQSWYQNFASLSERVLVVQPGDRKEEVAQHFGKILGWNANERTRFLELVTAQAPVIAEGKFFPGTYSVHKDASPEEVAWILIDSFKQQVVDRYTDAVAAKVPLADALTIASLLEREAYNFTDMREISGVIWNRLFAGMRLQIDATLQYAKGTNSKTTWWPIPRPKDKYIESAYNTYLHEGLPPTAIANPSLAAILAALNPVKTNCMYYFHDKDSGFHCAATYEEHIALLKQYYGRGK